MMVLTDDETRDDFDIHPDYPRLAAGAHRRRVTPISSPTLLRHLAFWNPIPDTGSSVGDPDAPRSVMADRAVAAVYRNLKSLENKQPSLVSLVESNNEFGTGANACIVLFEGAISAGEGEPVFVPADVKPDSYRTVGFKFLWRSLPAVLTFELHTEHVTLTTYFDLSKQRSEHEAMLYARRTDIARYVDTLEAVVEMARLGSLPGVAACKPYHDALYEEIWREFQQDILSPLYREAEARNGIGEKFVDFRGLVLGARDSFSMPFTENPDEKEERPGEPRCTALQAQNIWPLLKSNFVESGQREFTLSSLLSGQAFFVTALGEQVSISTAAHNKPLCYFVYEDTLNEWQLGRLVYRLNRAGTARIAAAMHFWELRKASNYLSRVETALENALGTSTATAESGGGTHGLREKLTASQSDVETWLGRIVSECRFDGTLASRVERSRYYVSHFKRVTKALRIDRVPGYQTYDEFVQQRVGPVFDNIDRIGRKYDRLLDNRALLLSRLQMLETIEQEQAIAGAQRTIVRAQRVADVALSCALIPYYVGSLFAHMLEGVVQGRAVWTGAFTFGFVMLCFLLWKGLKGHALLRYLIAFSMAVGATIAVTRLPDIGPAQGRRSEHGAVSHAAPGQALPAGDPD